jgi:hypothetical protein
MRRVRLLPPGTLCIGPVESQSSAVLPSFAASVAQSTQPAVVSVLSLSALRWTADSHCKIFPVGSGWQVLGGL